MLVLCTFLSKFGKSVEMHIDYDGRPKRWYPFHALNQINRLNTSRRSVFRMDGGWGAGHTKKKTFIFCLLWSGVSVGNEEPILPLSILL